MHDAQTAKVDWDHPFVQRCRMIPEHLLWEVFDIAPSGRAKWLERNGLRWKRLGGVRWFHLESIERWFVGAIEAPCCKDADDE